jgi:hypothetical protein
VPKLTNKNNKRKPISAIEKTKRDETIQQQDTREKRSCMERKVNLTAGVQRLTICRRHPKSKPKTHISKKTWLNRLRLTEPDNNFLINNKPPVTAHMT